MARSRNPFERRGKHDPKLALLRRADTERDSNYTIAGRERSALNEKKPITLPRVKCLEKPVDEEE